MLKVTKIYNIGEHLAFDFNNSSTAVFHKFGRDIFTTVTENLNKKSLEEIKKDINKTNWSKTELEKIYLCNTQN
jgi:S-adenosylmethionine hydrolase